MSKRTKDSRGINDTKEAYESKMMKWTKESNVTNEINGNKRIKESK